MIKTIQQIYRKGWEFPPRAIACEAANKELYKSLYCRNAKMPVSYL